MSKSEWILMADTACLTLFYPASSHYLPGLEGLLPSWVTFVRHPGEGLVRTTKNAGVGQDTCAIWEIKWLYHGLFRPVCLQQGLQIVLGQPVRGEEPLHEAIDL